MKHLILITVITVVLSSSVHASNSWRSYHAECGGKVNCMKAQAAAYQEFTYGDHNRDFQRRCRSAYISSSSKNYYGALKCVQKLQKDQEERKYNRSVTELNKKRTEYYDEKRERMIKENNYQNCIRRGVNSKKCARKYLR